MPRRPPAVCVLDSCCCFDLSLADERLDEEQGRVAALENIISQLEDKMQELSQLALTAGPSMSALEVSCMPECSTCGQVMMMKASYSCPVLSFTNTGVVGLC